MPTFEARDFKPRIDRVVPSEKIMDAHRYMESNEQVGKICGGVAASGAASGKPARLMRHCRCAHDEK